MHKYRANRYVLSKRLKESALMVGSRERVPDFGAGNWKGPTAVSVEPIARYCKQLTVGGTQVLPSFDIGGRNVVVWQVRRCAAVQTRVNCQSLPAWKTPGRGRRASEVRRAVSDPGRGQTSKCRWRHAQQLSTHAVTCPLLSLVHQQEQCYSNQSVNSQRCRRV